MCLWRPGRSGKAAPPLAVLFFCTTSFVTWTLARICWSCKFCFSRSFHYTHERHIDFMLPAPVSFTYACTSVQTSAPSALASGWMAFASGPARRLLFSCPSVLLFPLALRTLVLWGRFTSASNCLSHVDIQRLTYQSRCGRGELLFLSVGFVLVLLISQNSVFLKIRLFVCWNGALTPTAPLWSPLCHDTNLFIYCGINTFNSFAALSGAVGGSLVKLLYHV